LLPLCPQVRPVLTLTSLDLKVFSFLTFNFQFLSHFMLHNYAAVFMVNLQN
jgi:hypothetical protein